MSRRASRPILPIVVVVTILGLLVPSTGVHAASADSPAAGLAEARQQIFSDTNALRADVGLPPLRSNSTLDGVALECSAVQASQDTMAHCPRYSDDYPSGWTKAGENVAAGYTIGEVTTVGWRNSPPHLANIRDRDFTDIGIGYAVAADGTTYFTQNFARYTSTVAEPAGSAEIAAFDSGTTRLAGENRFVTAVRASQKFSPGVPALFVATGLDFPDALSAAAAAARLGGPLLLTHPTELSPDVLAEVERLAPRKIFVLGQTNAVSAPIFSRLSAVAATERLAGADRFATSLEVVERSFDTASEAIIATGRNFPDALSASGAAGVVDAPVILVAGQENQLSRPTLDTLARLGITRVTIAGSAASVSTGIENQLRDSGLEVNRYGGIDRYETAALINAAFFAGARPTTTFLATGRNFPDALAAAALAGQIDAPLFITEPGCRPTAIAGAMRTMSTPQLVVMGSTLSVSDGAANGIECLVSAPPSITGTPRVTESLTAQPGAWTAGTTFSFQWYEDGRAIGGATARTLVLTAERVGKSISVRVIGSKSGYTTASEQSPGTTAVTYPPQTPGSLGSCPGWAPIKGNASSMIYHVPGGQYYDRTNPEQCFRTEADAVAAGYRKSRA